MKRNAKAVWRGGLKDGKGTLQAPSGALRDVPYSFSTRFEDQPGTNPEELIAAAHAGCFSMQLSGKLNALGKTPTSIQTEATVTLEKGEAGFGVTGIHLDVVAEVPGLSPAEFEKVADDAKRTCPISRLLSSVPITMQARLGAGAATTA